MRAGAYDKEIYIYRVEVERNEFGEQYDDYSLQCKTRANVVQNHGSRTDDNNEIFYAYNKTFIVHGYIRVREFDYVEYEGKKYRILSILYEPMYNQKTLLTELVND